MIGGCSQINVLERTDRFGVPNSQQAQNIETATQRYSTEKTVCRPESLLKNENLHWYFQQLRKSSGFCYFG